MAKQEMEVTVTQPLLDRLLDYEPKLAADPYLTRAQSVRQLKAALRRDLEWLLNTRQTPDPAPPSFELLSRSLYNYGLPDLSTFSLNSTKDRQRLIQALETVIAHYEPRLMNVKVIPLEVAGINTKEMRFQIEGMLRMDPAPEHVSFDTVLQLASGEYQVKGERSAG
jgi:type VI secretion system protein ImpF